jgi:hypothetical protein
MKTNRIQSIRFVRRPRLIEVSGTGLMMSTSSRRAASRRALL